MNIEYKRGCKESIQLINEIRHFAEGRIKILFLYLRSVLSVITRCLCKGNVLISLSQKLLMK